MRKEPVVKVYMAGPDVFYPNPLENAAKVRELCAEYGIKALIPIDNEIFSTDKAAMSLEIFQKNVDLINKAHFVIANIEPFRGPSADVGTIWEIGYAYGLNKKIYTYSDTLENYKDRVIKFENLDPSKEHHTDKKGLSIEDFNNVDNLMIQHSIESTLMSLKEVLSSDAVQKHVAKIEKELKQKHKPKI